MRFQSLSWEETLAEGMATHSGILAWIIPWTEEPDGLQSLGLQRVGHESVILSNHLILCHPLLTLPSIFSQHQGLFQCQKLLERCMHALSHFCCV